MKVKRMIWIAAIVCIVIVLLGLIFKKTIEHDVTAKDSAATTEVLHEEEIEKTVVVMDPIPVEEIEEESPVPENTESSSQETTGNNSSVDNGKNEWIDDGSNIIDSAAPVDEI